MSREESKRHSFDAYCKRLVKNAAIDIQQRNAWQSQKEVSFSELPKLKKRRHKHWLNDSRTGRWNRPKQE